MSPLDMSPVEGQHEETTQALLVRVLLRNGTVLRYTDLDLDVTHDVDGSGAQIFTTAKGMRRGPITAGIDLQIDNTWIRVPNAPLTLGSVTRPVAHWVKVRTFHGALVQFYLYDEMRAASAPHSTWIIQGAQASLTEVEFALESFVSRLDVEIPRMLYQIECNHALGDRFCGVDLDLYDVTSTVVAATGNTVQYGTLTPSSPPSPATAYADGWFDKGKIEFTSGNLVGLRTTLATHADDVVVALAPFPEVPDVGSTIRLWPGCLERIVDCRDKFGANRTEAPTEWFKRFLGFPHMVEMEKTIGFGGQTISGGSSS
jgi:uncharacterized phage protein (TIGR02218 family)